MSVVENGDDIEEIKDRLRSLVDGEDRGEVLNVGCDSERSGVFEGGGSVETTS